MTRFLSNNSELLTVSSLSVTVSSVPSKHASRGSRNNLTLSQTWNQAQRPHHVANLSSRSKDNERALLSTTCRACRGKASSVTSCRRHAPRCLLLRPARVGVGLFVVTSFLLEEHTGHPRSAGRCRGTRRSPSRVSP